MTALREGQRQSSPPQIPQIAAVAGFLREPGFQVARGGTCYQPARIRSAPKPGKTSRPNPVSAGCKPAATGQLAQGPACLARVPVGPWGHLLSACSNSVCFQAGENIPLKPGFRRLQACGHWSTRPRACLFGPGSKWPVGAPAISLLEFGLLPSPGKPPAQTRFPQAASLRPLVNSPEGPREIASNRADNRIGKLLAAMKAGILLFPARQRVGQQVEHFLLVELVEEAGGHERCG
jgi:hypothetical protein